MCGLVYKVQASLIPSDTIFILRRDEKEMEEGKRREVFFKKAGYDIPCTGESQNIIEGISINTRF